MLEGRFVLCELVHESIRRTYNEGFYPAKNYHVSLRMCRRTRT